MVHPSGQILVGGSASECAKCGTNTALARHKADGSLDPSFGKGGIVSVKAIGAPAALALLSTTDILAIQGEAIAEFGSDGSLHSSVTSTVSGATIVATSQGGPTVFQTNGDFVFASSPPGNSVAGTSTFDWSASYRKAAPTVHSAARFSILAPTQPSARARER